MMTGRMTCPRCGVEFTYTCTLNTTVERTDDDHLTVNVTAHNIQHNHICKTPEPLPAAA